MNYEILRVEHLRKNDEGRYNLLDINFSVCKGEFLGLWVQSQMQRQCLTKILTGQIRHNAGRIYLSDAEVGALTPAMARGHGIYCVESRPALVPMLSVADNILLTGYAAYRKGVINKKLMHSLAQDILQLAGFTEMDTGMPAYALPLEHAHIVEILKAVALGASVILMDNIFEFYSDNQRKTFTYYFNRLKQEIGRDTAFVLLTNTYSSLWELADRGIIIKHGICIAKLGRERKTLHNIAAYLSDGTETGWEAQPKAQKRSTIELVDYSLPGRDEKFNQVFSSGAAVGIVDANQLFHMFENSYVQKNFPTGMRVRYNGSLMSHKKSVRFMQRELRILNCRMISESIVEKLGLFENITLSAGNPAFGPLGIENKRVSRYVAKNTLMALHAGQVYEKYKDARNLTQLTNSEKFTIMLARMLSTKPKLLVIIDPQICFDDMQLTRFEAVVNDIKAMGTALVLISSAKNMLLSVSDEMKSL